MIETITPSKAVDMTWIDFMHRYDDSISGELAEYILWELTAFPMCSLKTTTKQILAAIRIKKNSVKVCDLCGAMAPYHVRHCPNT